MARATRARGGATESKTKRTTGTVKAARVKKAPPTPDPSPPFAARTGGGETRAKRAGAGEKKTKRVAGEAKAAAASALAPEAAAEKKKRGPKPGTPSWRRFNYTPELIEDCRHRYEETDETAVSIALGYGFDECTVRRMARRFGWQRPPKLPRDVPVATRLAAEAAALETRFHAEVRAQHAATDGQCESGWRADVEPEAPPTPIPSPPRAARAGGGEEIAAALARFAADIERLRSGAMAELGAVEAMRAQMQLTPQRPADALNTARTIASLTETIERLQRMSCATPQAYHHDLDDDMPTDLDAFRLDLARRIDAFVESRTQSGAAGGLEGPASVDAVR